MKQLTDHSVRSPSTRGDNSINGVNFDAMTRAEFLRGSAALLLSPSLLWAKENSSEVKTKHADVAVDQALGKLFAQGFPQKLGRYFCSLGTNPELGFRWAGTTAEHASAMRVQEEMRKMGLSKVRREPVPVDVFEFKKAAVTIGAREMIASTFAGVQPTSSEGVTAPIVYVRGGTAADFDEVGDVAGKLVLLDFLPSTWGASVPAFEAAHRGATGIIFTFTPEDPKVFAQNDRTLGAFNSAYDIGAPPFLYVSQRDGDWMKSQIREGETVGTMVLNQKVKLAKDGGIAFNVVGELPGSSHDGQLIVLLAHKDAHFRAGMDNTAGLVNMLTLAKAMCISDFRPKHTIIFMAVAAEEFGRINSPYDAMIGSWWASCREHKEWIGRTRAVINMECQGGDSANLFFVCRPELKPWLEKLCKSNPQYLPFGFSVTAPDPPFSDQWPFSASGIPSLAFASVTDDYMVKRIHTNFDTHDRIDWEALKRIAHITNTAVNELDDGLLPYDLTEIAKGLTAGIDREQLLGSGADPKIISELLRAVAAFERSSGAYHACCASIPSEKFPVVNQRLLEIEKNINDGLTALSPSKRNNVYPHQEVLDNATGIKSVLVALRKDKPDIPATLRALENVGLTRIGTKLSYPVFCRLLERSDPSNLRLYHAEMGKLPIPIDLIPEYRAIEKGKLLKAIRGLEAKYQLEIIQLNRRLEDMTFVLQDVNNLMEGLLKLFESSLELSNRRSLGRLRTAQP